LKNIAAFGEVLFDVYPDYKRIGGAPLNFIFHINKFTGKGKIISRVGNDDLGSEAINFLRSRKIDTSAIQTDNNHQTGAAKVILNEKKEPAFNIEENRAYDFIAPDEELNYLIDNETDCLYFGLLAQRNSVSRNTLHSFFDKDIKYFCDINIRQNFYTKENLFESLKASDVVKLNLSELKLLNDYFFVEPFDLQSTSKKLINKFHLKLLAVTKGADGSVLFRGGESDEFKVELKNIVDTLGAGDAFASILCLGYLRNWDLRKINRLANEFAGEICGIKGALPDDDEIYNSFKKEF
jgi:fructokinase